MQVYIDTIKTRIIRFFKKDFISFITAYRCALEAEFQYYIKDENKAWVDLYIILTTCFCLNFIGLVMLKYSPTARSKV